MTDRAKELIATAKTFWASPDALRSPASALHYLQEMFTLAEQAIAQNDSYHAAVQVLHSRLEAEHARAEKAEAERDEYEKLFELQHSRMGEAITAWRSGHPERELVSPDLGELLSWLLADLAEARRMLKEAEHGRNDAEHDLVEGISYIRQTSRYVNDDRDCRAAWSWADDLQQRHDARVNARHQAREGT